MVFNRLRAEYATTANKCFECSSGAAGMPAEWLCTGLLAVLLLLSAAAMMVVYDSLLGAAMAAHKQASQLDKDLDPAFAEAIAV